MTRTCLGPAAADCAERFCWYHGPLLRTVGESWKFHRIFKSKPRTRRAFRLSPLQKVAS